MPKISYDKLHHWEIYSCQLPVEYQQCTEEGKDIEKYKGLFDEVYKLPLSEERERLSDVIFSIVSTVPQREDYTYDEPSTYNEITEKAKHEKVAPLTLSEDELKKRIHGAWMGRICGCLLGKTVEGIKINEFIPFLKATGNYPLSRYILRKDLKDELTDNMKFPMKARIYADDLKSEAPSDDDTNYVALALNLLERAGRDFTPDDVMYIWLNKQPKDAYCTAERIAFCNFTRGITPPESATYKNPYREWIGAQIRGDFYGYINPGDPITAADMAYRDASISHIKNGIYGEMFASAMIAAAFCETDIKKVIRAGIGEIPTNSRLYEAVDEILSDYEKGLTRKEALDKLYTKWDDTKSHDWCHTISNACIVAISLLYGEGDFGKTICYAVESGFDTDCNGATCGSVVGAMNGFKAIGDEWKWPVGNMLRTEIIGDNVICVDDAVERTMKFVKR